MATKQEAIAELQSRHDSFRSKIANLPPEAYSETWLGTWNLSQLLAHMTGWYGEMSGAMQRVAAGQPPTPAGVDYSDSDAWNAKFAVNAQPAPGALETWDAAFAKYRDAAAAIPEAQYGIDPEKGRPRIGNRLLQASGIGHFEEHEPQVTEWLASRNA